MYIRQKLVTVTVFAGLLLSTTFGLQAPRPERETLRSRIKRIIAAAESPDRLSNEAVATADDVPTLQQAEVLDALPDILTAVSSEKPRTKSRGALFLFAISQRPDSASLFDGHIESISALLDSSEARFQVSGTVILGGIRPVPPALAVRNLAKFVVRSDRDKQAQISAVHYLARSQPQPSIATESIHQFLTQPLQSPEKIATLNALAVSNLTDQMQLDYIVQSLYDEDPVVKLTAIQVITRAGHLALKQSDVPLRHLLEQKDTPVEVRNAAREALRKVIY